MAGRRRFWLIVPATAFLALDVALTLSGQPGAFWAGNYQSAVEGNPLALVVLTNGPGAFVVCAAAWMLLLILVVRWWRHWVSDWIAVLVAIGHAIGGSSWLLQYGPWGWAAAFVYMALASEIAWWCWRRAGWALATPTRDAIPERDRI